MSKLGFLLDINPLNIALISRLENVIFISSVYFRRRSFIKIKTPIGDIPVILEDII